MIRLYDEDGIDGPFNRGMEADMRDRGLDVLALALRGRKPRPSSTPAKRKLSAGEVQAVRTVIEKHRDEVAERCLAEANARPADAWSCSDAIDDAFDCLLALVEGKPWPAGR